MKHFTGDQSVPLEDFIEEITGVLRTRELSKKLLTVVHVSVIRKSTEQVTGPPCFTTAPLA